MSVSIGRKTILRCGAAKRPELELDMSWTDQVNLLVQIDNARLV